MTTRNITVASNATEATNPTKSTKATTTTTTSNTISAVVHSITRAGDRCLAVELRDATGGPLPRFTAGAHIDVRIPVRAGLEQVRQYSLFNPPEPAPQKYVIAVRLVAHSRGGSHYLHHGLRVGDPVEISAPRNHFGLADASRYLLIAGGIGITPLLAMAHELHAAGKEFQLHLYAANFSDAPLAEYLDKAPFAHKIHIHCSASGQSLRGADRLPWDYRPGDALYTCGPQGFMDQVGVLAGTQGWPQAGIFRESFQPTTAVKKDGESFRVVAQSTGQEMLVPKTATIAEVLRENGYAVDLSCEQGICGSCIIGVVDGIPDHRDEVQTEAEHALNQQINVCCSRSLSDRLTLAI